MPKKPSIPSYRLAKSTGLAYVALDDRRIYLGKHGTPESRERYEKTIAEWLVNGRRVPVVSDITVVQICNEYRVWADEYYRDSSIKGWIKTVIRTLVESYGSTPAEEFGPLAMMAVREQWVAAGYTRGTCNKYANLVRRIWKWAAAREKIPATAFEALRTVDGLRRGKTPAPDREAVKPVHRAYVYPIKKHVSPQVWAIIQLQRLTGARPGELLYLRPCDIETSGAVWVTRPAKHKTAHHGCERVIAFGPRAQSVLRPFMLRASGAYLFSAREATAARAAAKRTGKGRREDQAENQRATERVVREHYTPETYWRAINRACHAVNAARREKGRPEIEVWNPYRLRHTAATRIRAGYGLEAAQVVLGHEHAAVTEIYAERDMALLVKVMAEVG